MGSREFEQQIQKVGSLVNGIGRGINRGIKIGIATGSAFALTAGSVSAQAEIVSRIHQTVPSSVSDYDNKCTPLDDGIIASGIEHDEGLIIVLPDGTQKRTIHFNGRLTGATAAGEPVGINYTGNLDINTRPNEAPTFHGTSSTVINQGPDTYVTAGVANESTGKFIEVCARVGRL